MSKHSDGLTRVVGDLTPLLRGATIRPIDIGFARAEAWCQAESWLLKELPPGDEQNDVLGDFSFAAHEKSERRKTVGRATRALLDLPKLIRRMEADAASLRTEVAWLIAVLDPSLLPPADPECKSCRRVGEERESKIGDHFAPVYEKSKSSELCEWCWNYHQANGELPPIKACDIKNTRTARAAGIWLGQNTVPKKIPA